ncbi:MAG: Qat anti-phage system TatD family nuclease QatD [Thermoanaerobaculia bacterium]
MPLLDVHCHIDLYPDYAAVIREAEHDRVFTVAVTNAPSVFERCRELLRDSRYLHAAVGLHPQLVAERHHETNLLLSLIDGTPYVGEVGLDFTDATATVRRLQQDVLSKILIRCAGVGGRVVSLHSRRAAAETIDLVATHRPGTPILHWYSGPLRLIERALDAGCYFSVNPAMVQSETGRRIIERLPRDRVLTETDGPFLQVMGRPARPPDVSAVVEYLAGLWRVEPSEAHSTLARSFQTAFDLSDPWEGSRDDSSRQ